MRCEAHGIPDRPGAAQLSWSSSRIAPAIGTQRTAAGSQSPRRSSLQKKRPELGRAVRAEAAIEVQAAALDLRQTVSVGVAVDPPAHQLAALETFIRHVGALHGGQALGKGDLLGARPAGGIR